MVSCVKSRFASEISRTDSIWKLETETRTVSHDAGKEFLPCVYVASVWLKRACALRLDVRTRPKIVKL